MANTRFDSISYQKEVEEYQRASENRVKQFNAVFGDTDKNVTKPDGILKEAKRILSNPAGYLAEIKRRHEKAKKEYPK